MFSVKSKETEGFITLSNLYYLISHAFLQTFKFFEDAIEQLEPDSGVEKEYYLTNETAFVWRSLRLLARQSVPYFQHIQNTKNLTLTDNLQNIIMLIGKEYKKENGME